VRIVVLAPNWLGDLLMALPAISDLRRLYPDAAISLAARRPLAPIAPMIPGVDVSLPLDGRSGRHRSSTLQSDIASLRTAKFDVALLLPNSFHAAFIVHRARVPERWGYKSDLRSLLLTRAIPKPRQPRLHQAQYYQHLTRALGIPAGPLAAEIRVDAEHQAAADRLLAEHGWAGEPLVGLAPGAAYGSAKRWPPERMGVLSARLSRDVRASVVVVGTSGDRETVEAVLRVAAGRESGTVMDLAGKTDLPTLAGVLSRCGAFVSNDSGAMHLAAAVGVPVVGIFGPTREWATSPLPGPGKFPAEIVHTDVWCRPCMLRTCPIDHRCMTGIEVDDVMTPVLRLLDRTKLRESAR
jgi:heptosyltransferase-2